MLLRRKKKAKSIKELEPQDLYSCVEQLPYKRILKNSQEPLELEEYGYMQLLEIKGKDIYSMGKAEVDRTLINFYEWLTDFSPDFEIYTTTLPTETTNQTNNMKKHLNDCRQEMKTVKTERHYLQLLDKEAYLLNSIHNEELIRTQIYNTEFILLLFGQTAKELDDIVNKAKSYGNNEFVPEDLSIEKKEQILRQYNNMNEKL